MSNLNYGRERQLQDEAARSYVSGSTAAGTAGGQLYNAGLGLGMTGLGAATDIQKQIAAMFPQWAAAQGLPAQAELKAGQGLTALGQTQQAREQAQLADQRARWEGNQQAPYDTLSRYLENIGAKSPVGGTGSVSSPYFQNQGASMLARLIWVVAARLLVLPTLGAAYLGQLPRQLLRAAGWVVWAASCPSSASPSAYKRGGING
jgi:hypothetical protein